MRRQKSLRIGVHHADAVVWGPVYRTHLGFKSERRAVHLFPPGGEKQREEDSLDALDRQRVAEDRLRRRREEGGDVT